MDELDWLLKRYYGENAKFREGQKSAIEAILNGKRVLVVQKTGWGKSLVYFMATKLLRQREHGVTLIISPLLALMKNQMDAAKKLDVTVQTINSDNKADWYKVQQALQENAVDALIISPERLANEQFVRDVLRDLVKRIGLFVVDEAHCISDWGHDFRPDYRRIRDIINNMPSNIPVLAVTATANNRVIRDIREQLGQDLLVSRGGLMRESLALQVVHLAAKEERLAWLAENIPKLPGSGIIYCLTKNDCDLVCGWLTLQGIRAEAFYSNADKRTGKDKEEIMDRFMKNRVKVLVATTALGMGYDKPDIGFVIHFQRPGNLIAYYQQIGRAGRALDIAYAILMCGEEDNEINSYFIHSAFPTEAQMTDIIAALREHPDGINRNNFVRYVNMKQNVIDKCLKYLDVDGDIYRENGLFFKTPRPWNPDMKRSREITEMREAEQRQVNEFIHLDSNICYMQFIAEVLDDDTARPCGKCAHCMRQPLFSERVAPERVQKARTYVQNIHHAVEPRRMWPADIRVDNKRLIAPKNRFQPGIALSNYADACWGRMVQRGKYRDNFFNDELLNASVNLLTNFVRKNNIRWVTDIPSRRRPKLVHDFVVKLAAALHLEYRYSIVKTKDVPEQKSFETSFGQYQNANCSFDVIPANVLPGNLLLVDDMVDSRWTFTVCAYKLREAGSGEVFPYALADSGSGG